MKCLLSGFGSACILFTALLSSSEAATLVVTNAADAGAGTLRQAIIDANAAPGGNAIHFELLAPEPDYIFLSTALPEIVDTVIIDATTQPGFTNGSRVVLYPPADADGLVFAATNCGVRGLFIVGCRNGVVLRSASQGTIVGGTNYLPVNAYTAQNDFGNFLISFAEAGVLIEGGAGHIIQGNQISDCGISGIHVAGGSNGLVQGNWITQNNGPGVSIKGGVKCVLQTNEITLNGGGGLIVTGGSNHTIRANLISRNTGPGIDLGGDGVTLNDDKDPDEGANHLQNHPLLTTATYSGSNVVIVGTLNSRPNTTFTVDFYANLVCDESGYGEGRQHLGSTNLTTANNGNRNFTATLTNLPVGHYVTGTATDPAGNTSEFSPCVRLSSTVVPTTFTVTNVNDAGPGSLRQAILNSNARFASGPNTIAFNILGSGVRRILLTSEPLPQITESVIIDGYTQPGSSVNTASNAFNGVVRIRLDGIVLVSAGTYCRALDIAAGSSTVRGLNIMNFAYSAVACSGEGSNTISGNLIGITTDGEVGPTGSFGGGSYEASIVLAASSNNLVGGTNAAGRNVVAGGGYGDLWLSGSSSNRVLGNFFGCDTTGTNGISAFGFGVNIDGSTGNVIGGTNSLLRNVFLGHGGSDVLVINASAQNVVQGNYLGVGADGNPHDGGGMFLWGGSHDTLIGGTNSGSANLISGTAYIYDGTGNSVLRNSMVNGSNGGIDLGQDGPTLNDPDDSDTGANNLQNYPEILSAIRYPNRTVIRSRLQSVPSATYRIDFYDNDRPPPSGYAEARTWIGTTNVMLGASGQTNFNWSPAATLTPGHWVTATATDATNNTSELAPPVVVALSNEVNMVLTLNAPIDPVSRTSNFTYTVEVRNLGPTNATGVLLSNFLPANLSFVSASTTQGACALAGGVVTCSLSGLTNGGLATVALTVHPLTNGPAELTARVAANQPEAYPPDNVAVGGPFAGIADIDVVSGSFISNTVTAGQMYDTLITISNLGPDSAFVRVEVGWSGPDVPVSITTAQGTVLVSSASSYGGAVVGTMAAGGSSVISIRSLNTSRGGGGIFVRVVGDGIDPDSLDYFSGSPSIVPGPGVFTLENSVQEVGETAGSALLRVVRYGGAIGSVTVNYATSHGSATADADYTPVSGTLSFADGETEKFISMPVLDDFLTECLESLTVTLSSPTGGATFLYNGNTNCVVQILDNDPFLRGVVTGISVTATNVNASGDGFSETPSLSDDGRYLAFGSTSRNLAAGDPEVSYDVFVRDLMTGTTTLASVNRFGTNGADNGAYQPRLSADGRYLAFVSAGNNLVTNDNSSGNQQVYLRDMVSGTTRLLSTPAAGSSGAEGNSENPLITSNGLGVAFNSSAPDASAVPDANGANDVFFRDVSAGVTHLVSVNRWGTTAGNGESFLPNFASYASYRIHGRYVGFTSRASDLVIGDNNGFADVFVRDLTNGVTTLVGMNRLGTGSGNGESYDPLVSADGRLVLFYSSASDLVADDANETGDVFVRDLVAGTTRLVSVNRFGTASANGYSFHSGFSADGRYALFLSDASDLAEDDVNGTTDVFVRDLVAGTTLLVSRSCNGSGPGNNLSDNASISPDGRYVAFTSDATDLVRGAGGGRHAYLRDLATGTTTMLSANWRGGVSPWGGCFGTAVANGAATVAFLSDADDLLPIDENFGTDVFAWHALASNTVDLVVEHVDSPDPVWPGSNLTYTVTVLNRGLTNASGVLLTDTLPAGATFISASPSQGSCSHAAGVVTCPLGGINAGSLATVAITVVLPSSGEATNLATATSANLEAFAANNTKAETTALLALTDLAVSMVGGPDYVIPGQTVNFVVTVTNHGPQNAGGVVVTSTLLPYVVINSATASKGTVAVVGSEVRVSIGALAVNESATLELGVVTFTLADFVHETLVVFAGTDTVPVNNVASKSIGVRTNLGWMVLSPFAVDVPEGCAAIFTVTRTGQTNGVVAIDYETLDHSATAGIDYVSQSGTLNFADGETIKTIHIQTLTDAVQDAGEYFRVNIVNPTGGAAIGWPFSHGYAYIQAPPPPALNIGRSGNQVLITTWPCAPANCVLEGTTNLPAGNNWTAVPATVIDNGATRTLIVTNDMPFRFFRLRCP